MNTRQYKIVEILSSLNAPITLAELAERTEMKERSIRYDVDQLYYELRKKGVVLASKPGTGVWLEFPDNIDIPSFLKDLYDSIDVSSFNSQERMVYIIRHLLANPSGVSRTRLEKDLKISRNTAVSDTRKMAEWFMEQGIAVKQNNNKMLYLDSNEIQLRNAETQFYRDFYHYDLVNYLENAQSLIPGFDEHDIYDVKWVKGIITNYEKESKQQFTENSIAALTWQIILAVKHIQQNQFVGLDEEEMERLKESKEYSDAEHMAKKISARYHIEVPETEIGYITQHLQSMGRKNKPNQNNTLYITNDEIREFMNKLGIILQCDFTEDEKLVENLAIHLGPAIARAKNNVNLQNPLLAQIKEDYSRIFNAVKTALIFIEEKKGIKFSDDEIGFITLYVASIVEKRLKHGARRVNALIVCVTGRATSEMLRSRLESEFPEIKVLDTVGSTDLSQKDLTEAELIISTLPIENAPIEVIVVNPLLSSQDVQKLKKYLSLRSGREYSNNVTSRDVMKVVSNFADIRDYSMLEKNIDQLLHNNENPAYLYGLLAKERIEYSERKWKWNDALLEANRLLEKDGFVTERYGKRIIQASEEYENYFVLRSGCAIAHAFTDKEVFQTGFSLLVCKPGIPVEGHGDVHWLFELASVNDKIHYPAIKRLTRMIDEQKLDIDHIHCVEDVYRIFENACG